jgi:hypothetical protein
MRFLVDHGASPLSNLDWEIASRLVVDGWSGKIADNVCLSDEDVVIYVNVVDRFARAGTPLVRIAVHDVRQE